MITNEPIPVQESNTNEWLREHPKLFAAAMGGIATTLAIGGGMYGGEFTYRDEGCVSTPRNEHNTPKQNIINGLKKLDVAEGYDKGDMHVAIKKFEDTEGGNTRLCASDAPFYDFTGNPFIILSEDQ